MALSSLSLLAKNNVKLKIEGPEDAYNMVKVINQTSFADFNLTIYFLEENGDKMIVSSTLGNYFLKGTGDTDTVKVKTTQGQCIGVALPDGMEDVQVVLTYVDLPFFDIVQIVLSEDTIKVGDEF